MSFGNNVKVIPTSNPDEIRIDCPFCVTRGKGEDTKAHCYANTAKGVYNCFRCGARGGIGALRKYISVGATYVPEKFELLRSKVDKLFKLKKLDIIDLDKMSNLINEEETPIAWEYMLERGFSPEELIQYKVRVGKTFYDDALNRDVHSWSGRVIFPFYEDGQCVYVVGRAYSGREPRYLNTKGGKGIVIYNLDGVKDECLICEGIISAIAATRVCGIPSVAILGKFMSDHQLMKLKSRVRKVTVCLDGDVTKKEKQEFGMKLWGAGFDVWTVDLPEDSDPDEMGIAFADIIKTAKKFSL